MKHNIQIFLLILILFLFYLIYNTSTNNTKVDYQVKTSDKIDTNNDNIKIKKNTIKTNKYKQWEDQWLGRNIKIKSCYNNCTGLRNHEYINCVEMCMEQDMFGK
tara:strand:- start:6670 stop:6981 length:312 start_codon:yes stop_codon:yes gene_type:complete